AAEGTRPELRRCREAEAGRESGNGERGREGADPAAGDRNHRARNPEDVRLLPGERGGRAHREGFSGPENGESSGVDGSVAPGILHGGGVVESIPAGAAAERWSRSGA